MTPKIIASISGQVSLVDADTVQNPHRFVQHLQGVARLLDDRLEEVATREIGTTRVLAARGLDHLVVCDGSNLQILSDRTVVVSELPGDAAAFVGDLLIVTAPAANAHRIVLIDPSTGEVLDEVVVDAEEAAAFITPHPSESCVVIQFPMGQDGCIVQRVDVVDRSLHAEEILAGQDPVIAGFNPSGTRLLVTPYPSDPDMALVLEWPSLAEVGRLTAEALGAPFGIGLAACWLDEERIALDAVEDALVITDSRLANPQRATSPLRFGDERTLESLTPLAPGRAAAGLWTPDGRATLVFEL